MLFPQSGRALANVAGEVELYRIEYLTHTVATLRALRLRPELALLLGEDEFSRDSFVR